MRKPASQVKDSNTWIYDSACNVHVMPEASRFLHLNRFDTPKHIMGLGGKSSLALGSGSITLMDQAGHKYTLKDTLYVPEAEQPIISLMAARENGLYANFLWLDDFEVVAPKTGLHLKGRARDGIMQIQEYDDVPKGYTAQTRSQTRQIPAEMQEEQEEENDDAASQHSAAPRAIEHEEDIDFMMEFQTPTSPFTIEMDTIPASTINTTLSTTSQQTPLQQWHLRLGHAAISTLKRLPFITLDMASAPLDREPCSFAKSQKKLLHIKKPCDTCSCHAAEGTL